MQPARPALLRELLLLAWPVVLTRSSQAVIGFSDALMTAPLGEAALAATTTGSLNVFMAFILPMGMAFIIQSFAAQLWGQGEVEGARRYGWYGLLLAAFAGVLMLGAIPLVEPGLALLPYAPDVRGLMGDYMAVRLFAVAAVVGMEALGNWYAGLGNTRLPMAVSLLTMIVNVALNYLLIEGRLGAPALGVTGAAVASVVATWAGFLILLVLFVRRASFAPGKETRLQQAEMLRVVRFGLPNGFNWFLEFAAFMAFINVVAADLGTVTLAAFMAMLQVNSLSFMPAFGLASAGAILAGQAIGARRPDDVPRILRLAAATNAVWMLSMGAAYVLFPHAIMGLFAPRGDASPEIVAVGATMLALSAAIQLFDAMAMALSETLRAAGDTTWCLWARLVLAWCFFLPLGHVAVHTLGGGGPGAVLAMLAYMAALSLAFFWRFRGGAWRKIDLTGARAAEAPAVAVGGSG